MTNIEILLWDHAIQVEHILRVQVVYDHIQELW